MPTFFKSILCWFKEGDKVAGGNDHGAEVAADPSPRLGHIFIAPTLRGLKVKCDGKINQATTFLRQKEESMLLPLVPAM